MQKNPPKEVGLFRKFVSTARSITTGQVDLPLGILRLVRNLSWLEDYQIKPLSEQEMSVVRGYYNRIKEFPIGQERTHWAPEYLQKLDEKLDHITAAYQARLLAILARVVAEAA